MKTHTLLLLASVLLVSAPWASRAATLTLDVFPHDGGHGEIATLKQGERLFSNRDFTIKQVPAALRGMSFLRAPIDGMEILCTAPGEILVLTPLETSRSISIAVSLRSQGFDKDTRVEEFPLLGAKSNTRVSLHRKTLKAGDTLKLGKWGIVLGFTQATFKGKSTEIDTSEVGLTAAVAKRTWQGIPGLERTAKGRLFFTWFTGGTKEPMPENMVLLCHSDDGGKTHSPLQVIAAPKDGMRAYDPTPWIDPKGRLWYIFSRSNKDTGEHGVYARICENPDAPEPVFGPEFRVGFDVPFSFRMNKPTVLSTGEWVMPVTHAREPVSAWVVNKDSKQPALHGVAISRDEGKTWKLHGAMVAPPWTLEGMVTELKDGRLWLLARTGAGHLWESFSTDKGVTWSEGKRSKIENPGSRFFIRRLSSGNLLLVNHFNNEHDKYGQGLRTHLTAQISTDDGRTWSKGLLLDGRRISYPDGVEDKDGVIWITYDRDRRGDGEILMAKFREEDAMKGKNVSGAVVLKHVIDRLPGK